MSIESLEIAHFRCFSTHKLHLSPGFNLFVGQNGSGKTSLLEAVYYLGRAKSFKTHLPRRLIQRDQAAFSLFARVTEQQDDAGSMPIGVRYSTNGESCLRINGETASSRAELASLLPIQLINTESYRLIDSGPTPRREFLDWGVFHVKHDFLPLWRRLRHHLKQRNAAIKLNDRRHMLAWDTGLVDIANALDALRQMYFTQWLLVLTPLLDQLLPDMPIDWQYYRGWSAERSLADALAMNVERDLRLGYTTVGPQRCDIVCRIHGVPVDDVLSRGQQKLLVIAMRLAQGIMLYQQLGRQVIYLVDDVAAELDPRHRAWVLEVLQSLHAQVLLTAIERDDLTLSVPVTETQLSISNVSRETSVSSSEPLSSD